MIDNDSVLVWIGIRIYDNSFFAFDFPCIQAYNNQSQGTCKYWQSNIYMYWVWNNIISCLGFLFPLQYIRQDLVLVITCPLVRADSFDAMMSCPLHYKLLVDPGLVQAADYCGSQRMVGFVALNACRLAQSSHSHAQTWMPNWLFGIPSTCSLWRVF